MLQEEIICCSSSISVWLQYSHNLCSRGATSLVVVVVAAAAVVVIVVYSSNSSSSTE